MHSEDITHYFAHFVMRSLGLLFVIISLQCLGETMVQGVSMSKPGCPERCGNITIPYPFGIGAKCSANSSFEIVCQNTTSRPFLSSIDLEVLRISVLGVVIVKNRVWPLNCSYIQRTQNLTTWLVGSPFTISAEHNSLAVLGCLTSIWLRPNATTTTGSCMPICDPSSTDASCNGVNCCQTTLPRGIQSLQFIYQTIGATNRYGFGNNGSCGYVFPVEKKWLQEGYKLYVGLRFNISNPFDLELESVPLVLEWKISKSEYIESPYSSCDYGSCTENSVLFNSNTRCLDGYRITIDKNDYIPYGRYCFCLSGFEGNPYLLEGCVDIDECIIATTKGFCTDGTCVNEIGSYTCSDNGNTFMPKYMIALISIGGGLGALILLVAFWKMGKAIRRKIKANCRRKFFKRNGGLLLEQQLSSTEKYGVERTMLFTAKELEQATDRFNENRILGGGGQGTVYKGMLRDGRIVAVKKSKKVAEDDLELFINEVVILSQINHRNIVKLLGCCLETEVPLLVYEFIPNGTLFQHIHDPNEEFQFSWEIRLRVSREIAGALSYLHSDASAPIYHRDIKSTNILLDDKYRAKVSDFGTSRSVAIDQTHLTTRVLGTFGYLDPEYFQSSQFTEKSDVYSFGVVMVELLTGEKAISSARSEGGKSLATHFLQKMEEENLFEILDSRVLREGNEEEIMVLAELARRCLHLNGKRRPSMKEIVVELEGIQMPREGSTFPQNKDHDMERYAHEISGSHDLSSMSGSMHSESNSWHFPVNHISSLVEP